MAQKTGYSAAWSGWVAFGACVLLVLGVINIFQGITALVSEGYFVSTSGDLLVWSFTTWGVILLIFGGLQLLVGFGLLSGREWARWSAVALVMLNIIAQIGFLKAYPIWASIVIALNVVVMYALTARWAESQGMATPVAGGERDEREWASAEPQARRPVTTAPPGAQEPGGRPGGAMPPGATGPGSGPGTQPPASGPGPAGPGPMGPGTGGTGSGGTDPSGIA